MRFFALLITALIALACNPARSEPTETGITRACVRSFPPTLDAWEAELGDVPAGCRNLDLTYAVQIVAPEDMPCAERIGVNQTRTDCVSGGVIYLNQTLDDLALVDASVHGWVHTLAKCVHGDLDMDHLRARLWAVYGAETVEVQALAGVEVGSCL